MIMLKNEDLYKGPGHNNIHLIVKTIAISLRLKKHGVESKKYSHLVVFTNK